MNIASEVRPNQDCHDDFRNRLHHTWFSSSLMQATSKMNSQIPSEETSLLPKPPFITNATTTSLTGYLLILIASLCYPVVALLIRYSEITYSYPAVAGLLLRSLISIILAVALLPLLPPSAPRLPSDKIIKLITSAVLGAAHFIFMYAALLYSPLATYATIQTIGAPLTAVICAIFLGEEVRKSEIIALGASALGVVLIAHPGRHDFDSLLGVGLALLSVLLAAFWCMLLRAMGDVHVLFRVLFLAVFIGIEASCISTTSDWSAILQKGTGTMIVSIASALSFATMMAFNAGMKRCRGGPALLVMTVSVPFSFALGWLFLGESAGWLTMLGAGLVIGSAGIVGLEEVLDGRCQG